MYKKFIALSLTILVSHIYYASDSTQQKRLRLHFDINKTIIATDAVQGKDLGTTINGIIAECTIAQWDGEKNQSYYAYVTDRIAHENQNLSKTDDAFKAKRSERLKAFPEYLKQYPEYLKKYEEDKMNMTKRLTGEGLIIFPSFYKAIQWLEATYPEEYEVYFRTFGTDLPEVVQTVQSKTALRFANNTEYLKEKTPRPMLLRAIAGIELKHYAIRDDYDYWKAHRFQAVGGKPFYIDRDDPHTVFIFFDDNANDQDKPIIYPFGPQGVEDTEALLKSGHVVAVNPKEAILDEDYFINKIKAVL